MNIVPQNGWRGEAAPLQNEDSQLTVTERRITIAGMVRESIFSRLPGVLKIGSIAGIAIACALAVCVPASLFAADNNIAMLHSKGEVLRNGAPVASDSAIVSGDLLETRGSSVADLNTLGSSVIILPGSLVEFQGQALSVEHGGVDVATAHGIIVRVGCMTVAPLSSAWTQFQVIDVNGTIGVAAKKNDVSLARESAKKEVAEGQSDTLREGEQTTRDESNGCNPNKDRKKDAGAYPAGTGGPLNSEWVKYGGIAALGGLAVWLPLMDDDPVSPWKP